MNNQSKICLITGPTSGIGKAAAEKFASRGCELILVARNKHRGEKLTDEIIRKTGNSGIRLFTADLSSISEIKELSEKIHTIYNRIDILINNAGAYFSKFHKTTDGIEASYAVNYLSRFLLTNLMLDLLMKSDSGKIISITGEHYRKGYPDFSVYEENNYTGMQGARRAKFADMMFVFEIARRLNETNISINAVHPGSVSTNIIKNDPDATFLMKFLYSTVQPFFRSPYKAADDIINLAFMPGKLSGKYFCCGKIKEPAAPVCDKIAAGELWNFSESLTGYKNTFLQAINGIK